MVEVDSDPIGKVNSPYADEVIHLQFQLFATMEISFEHVLLRIGPHHQSTVRTHTRSFAVRPLPPVEEENLMRRNFACTPVTVRASPAVFVVVSMV